MIGLDTNVLVRYFVGDDTAQASRAAHLIESHCTPQNPGCISTVVLVEIVWMLDTGYNYAKSDILRLLEALLETSAFFIQESEAVRHAIARYREGKADFADYMIGELNRNENALPVYTFDKRLAREKDFCAP